MELEYPIGSVPRRVARLATRPPLAPNRVPGATSRWAPRTVRTAVSTGRVPNGAESHAGSIPYRSWPGQTALASGASMPHAMPALARACTSRGSSALARMSAATRPNSPRRSSTQAAPSLPPKGRCVNTPASLTSGNADRIRAVRRTASRSGAPTRPSPLSIFRKIDGGRARAAWARVAASSKDWMPTVMPASISGAGSQPSPVGKSRMSQAIPPRRSASASAGLPSDSQRSPSASRQRAIARSPWPYAFALTHAISSVPAASFRRTSATFSRSAARRQDRPQGRGWRRLEQRSPRADPPRPAPPGPVQCRRAALQRAALARAVRRQSSASGTTGVKS